MNYQWMAANTSRLQSSQQEALQQASTGRRVNAPSDDPTAAAEFLRQKARLDQTGRYRKGIEYAQSDLELAEGALDEAGTIMQRVREITVQGSNGSITDSERSALAVELEGLRSSMLGLANTRGSKGSIFAGSQTDADAFDSGGVFQGDDAENHIALGSGLTVQTNASGAQAFTAAGGRDIFADLATLHDALLAKDDATVRASLETIDAGHKQLLSSQASVGVILDRLDTSNGVLEQAELTLQTSSEATVAVEAHKAYSRLVSLGQALETSLTVTRQILDTSSGMF
jgi:flagellar hook-associated protein 3 FlgL